MRVRLSVNASGYLRREGHYLRQRSPSAAAAFSQSMTRAIADLALFSQAGFAGDDLVSPSARRLVRHGYRIDYTLRGDTIWVIAISSSVNTPLATPDDQDDFEI